MEVGFSQFFSSIAQLFGVIYTSGYMLYSWLVTPLIDSTDVEYASFFGELAEYSPLELMFGPALIVVLVLAFVKFILPT